MDYRKRAGWAALIAALALALEASVARWFPAHTSAGSESLVITALLAFAAASFGMTSFRP